jgi:hypothetical protein
LTKKSYALAEEVLGRTHSPAHALVQLLLSLLTALSLSEKPVVDLSSSFLRSTAAEHEEVQAEAQARGRLARDSSSARPQAVGEATPAAPEELASAALSSPPRGPLPSATQAATVSPALRLTTLEEEEGGGNEAAVEDVEEEEELERGFSLSSISSIAYFFATDPRSWKKEMGSSSGMSLAEAASEEEEETESATARSAEARKRREVEVEGGEGVVVFVRSTDSARRSLSQFRGSADAILPRAIRGVTCRDLVRLGSRCRLADGAGGRRQRAFIFINFFFRFLEVTGKLVTL